MVKDKKALFISYNAASEPIVRSQVLPYLNALSAEGVKFIFLTFEKNIDESAALRKEFEKSGIVWIRRTFHGYLPVLSKIFDIINGFLVAAYLCVRKDVGIVHSRGVMPAIMAILAARIARARFIFDIKSSLAEAYRTSGRIRETSLTYRILSSLERLCVLNADEIIVETGHHKALLEKMTGSGRNRPVITVLPCCVDVARFSGKGEGRLPPSEDEIRLVYLGSMSGWYMISQMLDFFKVLKNTCHRAEFIFLTDDKESSLARLADSKNMSDIKIVKAPYEDVPRYLSGATAGILFKWPNERLDSFPIKVGEYLAAGLPIVANSGMGDVEDMVLRNRVGVLVERCAEESYIKAIKDLQELRKDAEGLRARCIETATRYLSLNFGILQYKAIYNRSYMKNTP